MTDRDLVAIVLEDVSRKFDMVAAHRADTESHT